jgi:hypothetical protein
MLDKLQAWDFGHQTSTYLETLDGEEGKRHLEKIHWLWGSMERHLSEEFRGTLLKESRPLVTIFKLQLVASIILPTTWTIGMA